MKKTYFFTFWLGKKHGFSHTWCHDISWSVPLNISLPLLILALDLSVSISFMLIILSSRWPVLAALTRKSPMLWSRWRIFFPQERPLRGRNLKHCCIFSSLGKKLIVDCRNQTNLNKIVEQMNKNIKIQSKIASFSHFGWQLWGPHPKIRTQKKHKKTYFGRIKPY